MLQKFIGGKKIQNLVLYQNERNIKTCFFVVLVGIGGMTLHLFAPLKLPYQDGLFGTLESQIRKAVIEILVSK